MAWKLFRFIKCYEPQTKSYKNTLNEKKKETAAEDWKT